MKMISRSLTLLVLTMLLTAAFVNTSKADIGDGTDLEVTITDSPDPVMRGANVTYTITVTNTTAAAATNFNMNVFITNHATFFSFTAANGFACNVPQPGSTDMFQCTAATVAGNSTNVFTLVLKVNENAGLGASLYQPVTISASNDTNSGNNSAAEDTTIAGGLFVTDRDGNYQTTNINTPFPANLRVQVTDGNEVPIPGVDVIFTAPSTGASGTFSNGMTTVTVTSDKNGHATAPTFTANGTAGEFEVTATTEGANGSATFYLTNVAPMTYVVSNTSDDGAGSLRQAIGDADENSGDDTIIFDQSVFSTAQTITLNSGALFVGGNGTLTISGPGANLLTISGGNSSGIFDVGGADLTLNDLKLANGNGENGGAISAFGGNLKINRCAFYNNVAQNGGAIDAFSTDLTVTQSTFFGNQAQAQDGSIGGAISLFAFEGGTTTIITNSTFNQNTASRGGAIYKGFPIFGGDPLELDLSSVTIAGNTATDTGGGVFVIDGNFNVINSIIAGNAGGDINGTISSQGYNLIQSTANTVFTGGAPQSTDIIGTSPMLAALANNGGGTDTMMPLSGSPVIDKGTSANLQNLRGASKASKSNAKKSNVAVAPNAMIDQRGRLRPFDNPTIPNAADGSDIGAVEASAPTAAGIEIVGRVISSSDSGIGNAQVLLTDQNGQVRIVKTNQFGYFVFQDIQAGETYVISVKHKNYAFTPQIISATEDIRDLLLTATNNQSKISVTRE